MRMEFMNLYVHSDRVGSSRRIVMLFSAVVEKNYEEMVHTICETGCIQEVVVTEIHGSQNCTGRGTGSCFPEVYQRTCHCHPQHRRSL